MARQDRILESLMAALKQSERKTSAYDTSATVRRIEGGIAWVHIPGGVDETPVKLTINAKAGDTVQVRVSGGRAFMVGNATAPPTDDRVANSAVEGVKAVNKVVQTVRKIAESAARIAGNTNQYFWHAETGTDTGAHITEIPQEDFLADPENGGGNLLARSNGVAVRDGLKELSRFSGSGLEVLGYDDGDNEIEIAHLGFGESNDPLGRSIIAPYASIGYRLPNSPIGGYSTAEGHSSTASGYASHAEGALNVASGGNSHAEGGGNVASGGNSHAGGLGTIASGRNQTAVGEYNKEDATGRILFMVGNGTGDTNRSNAFEVDRNGKAVASGTVAAGAVTSYAPTWSSGHTPEQYHCVVSAGICSFSYRGPTIAHAANTQIGTLPVGARPKSLTFAPFVKMGGGVVGCMRIYTTGVVEVMLITDTASTGRLYFNCTFPVV